MHRSKIEWVLNPDNKTLGWIWNPITGCLNGCSYCYARKLANGRLKARYLANENWSPISYYADVDKENENHPRVNPFHPRFWEGKLWEPAHRFRDGNGKGIFVCDMSDLFGIGVPEEWTQRVMNIISVHQYHRFYLLTKQWRNLVKWSPFPPNAWVGVTVTSNGAMTQAYYGLSNIKATVRYISFEPLLGSVGINDHSNMKGWADWVIIGAQTKPFKPPKIEWVREIVDAAVTVGVPVFLKNNLKGLTMSGAEAARSWNLAQSAACGDQKKNLWRLDDLRQEFPKC